MLTLSIPRGNRGCLRCAGVETRVRGCTVRVHNPVVSFSSRCTRRLRSVAENILTGDSFILPLVDNVRESKPRVRVRGCLRSH